MISINLPHFRVFTVIDEHSLLKSTTIEMTIIEIMVILLDIMLMAQLILLMQDSVNIKIISSMTTQVELLAESDQFPLIISFRGGQQYVNYYKTRNLFKV